jgi:hypothetical protein
MLYLCSPGLRQAVDIATLKFFSFLGFIQIEGGFQRAEDFEKGAQYWLCKIDHDHRRISRLLIFFSEIGLADRAVSLLDYLESELRAAGIEDIEALSFWRSIIASQGRTD